MEIRTAAVKFLLLEKSERWSFNYWARNKSHQSRVPYPPYPDDLDDTFAALAALMRHDQSLIDARAFSAIAKILIVREVREGGPYRTWLVADDTAPAWQDLDIVVNSTIGYALSLIGVHLPKLESFISEAVRQNRLVSPYYPGILHVGYFLSRFYSKNGTRENADARAKLADIIIDRLQDDDTGSITALEHAMGISSLINLEHTDQVPRMADLLVKRLDREGFCSYAFCIDPTRDGRRCYAGASALTAAFCAEALARYSALAFPATIDDHVRSLARIACRPIGMELREAATAQIEKMTDKKITALPYELRDALYKQGSIVPLDIVEQLSLANLYGWMAYEIYDDALDGDGGHASIPCGNFFLRSLTEIYAGLATHAPEIKKLFADTMDRVDNANAWEQKYCRLEVHDTPLCELPDFGDYRTLADRSIGHAMGPLAELLFAGYGTDSEEYKNCESFFRHYLIARQLHDDAHDWVDDLLHRRVNSVAALVLTRFKEKYSEDGTTPNAAIAIILPQLRKIFWEGIIDEAVNTIISHIAQARRTRQKSSLLDRVDFMESELRKLESGAQHAIKERNEALVFLSDYMA